MYILKKTEQLHYVAVLFLISDRDPDLVELNPPTEYLLLQAVTVTGNNLPTTTVGGKQMPTIGIGEYFALQLVFQTTTASSKFLLETNVPCFTF